MRELKKEDYDYDESGAEFEYEESEIDEIEDDEDDEDDEEEDEEIEDIEWGVEEFPIRDWLQNLKAEHVGWLKTKLTSTDTPSYKIEEKIATVVASVPTDYMGLKEISIFHISCLNGDILVLFDDFPQSAIIKPENYKAGMEKKIEDIEGLIGEAYKNVRTMINEDKATRVVWIGC